MTNGCVSEQHLLNVLAGRDSFTRTHEQHIDACDRCAERFDLVMLGALKNFERESGIVGRAPVLSEVEGFLPDSAHLTEDHLLLFYDHGCTHSESEPIAAHLSECSHCRRSFLGLKRELDEFYTEPGRDRQGAVEADEVEARRRWQELQEALAPHANGHSTVWHRIVRVVTGRGDPSTSLRTGTGTGRHGDRATRRRVGFALACAAGIAIFAFIFTHRRAPTHRQPVVVRRDRTPRAPASQRKPSIEPTKRPANESATQPPSHPVGAERRSRPLGTTEPPKDADYARNDHVKVGTFVKVMGAPTIAGIGKGERGSRVLKPSDGVYTAVRIVTGDADKAELQFNDGTTLALNFNTTLEIPGERLAVNGEQSAVSRQQSAGRPNVHTSTHPHAVRLLLGHLWAKVHKAPDQKFIVETLVATAAVRGTEFGLKVQRTQSADSTDSAERKRNPRESAKSADKPLEAVLTVKEGRVEFANALGKVEATAMTETIARPDSKPTEPKRVNVLKTFPLNAVHYWGASTSRLKMVEAAERLVFPLGWAGLSVEDVAVAPSSANNGLTEPTTRVQVVRVKRGSPAESAGIQVGDVVTAIDGRAVSKADEVTQVVFAHPEARVALTVLRADQPKSIALQTSRPPDATRMPALSPSESKELRAATYLLIQGKTDEAERAFDLITRHSPLARPESSRRDTRHSALAAAHNNLGLLFETRDEMGAAVRHFEQAVRAESEVALYHFNLGMALRKIANLERSLQELETASRLAPRWARTSLELSEAYSLVDRSEDGLKTVEDALRIHPQLPEAWVEKGKTLMKLHRTAEAREAINRAIELEPTWAEAFYYLADTYHDENNYAETERYARRAIDLDPGFPRAHGLLGHVYLSRRQLFLAETAYRKAIELAPSSAGYHESLGNASRLLGQTDNAIKAYQRAIELDPDRASAYSNLGVVYRERKQFDEAEKMYRKAEQMHRKAIEIDPNNAWTCYWLGLVLAELRQFDEAEKMFRKAIELGSNNLSAHNYLVLVLVKQGKLAEAEAALQKKWEVLGVFGIAVTKAIKFEFDDAAHGFQSIRASLRVEDGLLKGTVTGADPYMERLYLDVDGSAVKVIHIRMKVSAGTQAQIYWKTLLSPEMGGGKSVRFPILADNEFHEYIVPVGGHPQWDGQRIWGFRLDPTNGVPSATFEVDWIRGTNEEVSQALQTVIEHDPGNVAAYIALGDFHRSRGQFDQAEKMWRKAIELDPKNAGTYANLGRVLAELRQFEEAEKLFRKALELEPNRAQTKGNLARLLADRNANLDEALALILSAQQAEPKNVYHAANEALVRFKRGEIAEAEATLNRAVDLGKQSTDAGAWAHVGSIFETVGKRAAAMDAYRTALTLQPDNKEAREGIERLEKEAKGGMPDDK